MCGFVCKGLQCLTCVGSNCSVATLMNITTMNSHMFYAQLFYVFETFTTVCH